MKKNILLGALATFAIGLGFSSCSSDEPVNSGEDQNQTVVGQERYMAVRISTAGLGGSRAAASDSDFEAPVGDYEGALEAKNVAFYFFTQSGNPYVMSLTNVNGTVSNTNMVQPTSITKENTNGDNTTLTGTLVLGVSEDDGYLGNKPYYVVCIANSERFNQFANKTMAAIKDMTSDEPSEYNGPFVMTSATYYDPDQDPMPSFSPKGEVYYTYVYDKIYSTADSATANAAQIYIERLAAKIRVTGLDTYVSKDADTKAEKIYTIIDSDSTTQKVKLAVELTGWRVLNTAKATLTFKSILGSDGTPSAPFADWNDLSRHRSYWAYTPTGVNISNTKIELKDASSFSRGNFDSNNPTENIRYVFPNTLQWDQWFSVSHRNSEATAIVVRGVVNYINEAEDGTKTYTPANLIYWGGTYYDYDQFLNIVVEAWNTYYDNSPSNQITANNLSLVADDASGANKWKIHISKGENINQDYTRFSNISHFDHGITSFFVNIQHAVSNVSGHEGDPVIGVVRNHIYDYTFDGVIGLGVPGDTLEDPEDEEETYLAARVNVLNWHLVSNKLTLQ